MPTEPPLSLNCEAELLGSEVIISCLSSRDFSTLQFTCSFDGTVFTEGCKFNTIGYMFLRLNCYLDYHKVIFHCYYVVISMVNVI